MSGKFNGLQALIRRLCPMAFYVHCYCHRLNLALEDACKSISHVRNALGTVNSIYTLIGGSAKRQAIFENIQKEHLINLKTLKRGCDPRWGSKKGNFLYRKCLPSRP